MLYHLRRDLKLQPELKLHEDDFVVVFNSIMILMEDSKIDEKIWAYVMLGLSNATRGKDGSKKANVRTDLG